MSSPIRSLRERHFPLASPRHLRYARCARSGARFRSPARSARPKEGITTADAFATSFQAAAAAQLQPGGGAAADAAQSHVSKRAVKSLMEVMGHKVSGHFALRNEYAPWAQMEPAAAAALYATSKPILVTVLRAVGSGQGKKAISGGGSAAAGGEQDA